VPHVTFVHGLANKPPADALHARWKRALAADGGLDLDAAGVSSEMVYWADVVYERPEEARGPGGDAGPADDGAGTRAAGDPPLPAGARGLADAVRRRLADPDVVRLLTQDAAGVARAIPLPGFVERWLMRHLVRDAHFYLYDEEVSPRPGTKYRARTEIRRRLVDALARGAAQPGPHVIVSHSLGTVIAYDCLAHVGGLRAVDGFLTLGSPLGLSEVQDGFGDGWESRDAFPRRTVPDDGWENFYDKLDVVCAVDVGLANDYRRGGRDVVTDTRVRNMGTWRHDISEYLSRDELRESLGRRLGI